MVATGQSLAALDRGLLQQRLSRIRTACERRPLDLVRGTPPQLALWRATAAVLLLRTGNQLGKTWAAICEAVWSCLGSHPYKPLWKTPPITCLFVCVSWQQSLQIQEKLWNLLPKNELVDGCVFDPKHGFGANSPLVQFRNGSRIYIRTENQGAKNMAGGTVDLVFYDEPPKSRRLFNELRKRLLRKGGRFIMTMTPINARIDWIREEVEHKRIVDLHFRMTPENMAFSDGTPLMIPNPETGQLEPTDERWIERQRKAADPIEEPVVLDGEWEFRSANRVFAGWDPDTMVVADLIDSPIGPRTMRLPNGKPVPVRLFLGLDWGDTSLRTAGVVVAIYETDNPEDTLIWILGEYLPERSTVIEDDARGVLAMLSNLGLRWSDLSGAFGDKRYTDATGKMTKKSNAQFEQAVAAALGNHGGKTDPPVWGAKKQAGTGRLHGQGAVAPSIRDIHGVMLRRKLWCDKSAKRMVEGFETWDFTERHPRKDVIDALRYALVTWWARKRRRVLSVASVSMRG